MRSARHLHLRLGHRANVGELQRRVVVVVGLMIAFGSEVNVSQTAQMGTLFSDVHFINLM